MAGGKIIRVGDATTHGGKVISGDTTMIVHGRPVARVGDMVICPACQGTFPIVEGNPGMRRNGKPIAYEGCRTSCGAQLLASEATFHHNVPSGGGGSAVASPAPMDLLNVTVDAAHQVQTYHGRVQVMDRTSGRSMPNVKVRLTCTDGQSLECVTDPQGYTPTIHSDQPASVDIEILDQGQQHG